MRSDADGHSRVVGFQVRGRDIGKIAGWCSGRIAADVNEVGRKLRGVHDGEEERVSWFMIVTEENKLLNAIGWEGLFSRSAGLDWRVVGGTLETSEQGRKRST